MINITLEKKLTTEFSLNLLKKYNNHYLQKILFESSERLNFRKVTNNNNNNQPSYIYTKTSKSRIKSFVSSVPFRLPTAQTSFLSLHFTLHTTPPLPPLSNSTKLRIKSPVFMSHSFTDPSSELVTTNFELNCKEVTALKCL